MFTCKKIQEEVQYNKYVWAGILVFSGKNILVSVFWILLLIDPEFKLRNQDLWFTRLYWNSMTESFVILTLSWQYKKSKKYQWILISFKPNYHMNMLIIIIYEYFQQWILLISFLYLALTPFISTHSIFKSSLIWPIYFLSLTNYSNYIPFDEGLAFLGWLKK